MWHRSISFTFQSQFQCDENLQFIVNIFLVNISSQQFFAHTTTAMLSCRVQNFVVIGVKEFGSEQTEISMTYEL